MFRVVDKSDVNLMPASNLAVVFSPTIMRDATGARQISDMSATNICVKFLIENAYTLFPAKSSADRVDGVPRQIDNRI
jgi:Rho-type GTPase-activating protein 1/2